MNFPFILKSPSLCTNSSNYLIYLVFGFQWCNSWNFIREKFSFIFINHAIFFGTNVLWFTSSPV